MKKISISRKIKREIRIIKRDIIENKIVLSLFGLLIISFFIVTLFNKYEVRSEDNFYKSVKIIKKIEGSRGDKDQIRTYYDSLSSEDKKILQDLPEYKKKEIKEYFGVE